MIDKPGQGIVLRTDLDLFLRTKGIAHLMFTGGTTGISVRSTLRKASDRGCKMQDSMFGAVARSELLLARAHLPRLRGSQGSK